MDSNPGGRPNACQGAELDSIEEQIVLTSSSKICTSCGRKFSSQFALCPDDGCELAPCAAELLLGTLFDKRYRIETLLGTGAMGAVYRAHHLDLNRLVAIKILHSDLKVHEDKLLRFLREGQALCLLSHQNIVPAYGFGVSDDAQAYLVLQYVEGKGLDKLIREEGALDPVRAVSLFLQICDGLQEAHRAGIVHRDLKPSNIMVVETNDGGMNELVKIFDFGFAGFIPGVKENKQKLTQTGRVFGSPSYMSPEQWRGQKVDVRSDVYSMGCVMYECLTALLPLSMEDLLKVVWDGEDIKPQVLRKLKPEHQVSPELEAVILKSMEIDADKRYQSIAELKVALEQTPEYASLYGTGEIHRRNFAAPIGHGQFNFKGQKYSRIISAAPLVLALLAVPYLLILATDETVWLNVQQTFTAAGPRQLSILQKLGEAYFRRARYVEAADTFKKLQALLEQNGGGIAAGGSLAKEYERLADTYQKIGNETLKNSYARKAADLYDSLATKAESDKRLVDAIVLGESAIRMKKMLGPRNTDALDIARNFIFLARCNQKQENNDQVVRDLDAALQQIERQKTVNRGDAAARLLELQVYKELESVAQLYYKSFQYKKASGIYARLLAVKEKTHSESSMEVIGAVCSLAWSLSDGKNTREAEPLFLRALKAIDKVNNAELPGIATRGNLAAILESLGFCELDLKKYDDAIVHFARLIKICDEENGDAVLVQRRKRAIAARSEALSRLGGNLGAY